MLKNLKKNDHGVVFVTVLIIILVSMIMAVTVLSLNISQIKSTEQELKYIEAELQAQGILSYLVINQFAFDPATAGSVSISTLGLDGATVVANIDRTASPPVSIGAPNSRPVSIGVTIN